MEGPGIWYFVRNDGRHVLLTHGREGVDDPVAMLKITPAAAAGLGASLVAHAVELDPEAAQSAVGKVLLGF